MNPSELLADPVADLDPAAEFTTRGRTITEADLTSFSALTGDWHPQHSDAEWASQSRFGSRVAHGMLVLSYALGLVPFDPDRVVALRGFESVSFKRPVAIGDTIRVAGSFQDVRPFDEETALVRLVLRIRNQADELVARAVVAAVWRRPEATVPGDPEPELEEVFL